jgi:hypothetical protein
MADSIKLDIETDGTISVSTDEISPTNHKSADDFLRMCKELAGGTVIEKKLPHGHKHQQSKVKVSQ